LVGWLKLTMSGAGATCQNVTEFHRIRSIVLLGVHGFIENKNFVSARALGSIGPITTHISILNCILDRTSAERRWFPSMIMCLFNGKAYDGNSKLVVLTPARYSSRIFSIVKTRSDGSNGSHSLTQSSTSGDASAVSKSTRPPAPFLYHGNLRLLKSSGDSRVTRRSDHPSSKKRLQLNPMRISRQNLP